MLLRFASMDVKLSLDQQRWIRSRVRIFKDPSKVNRECRILIRKKKHFLLKSTVPLLFRVR